MPINISGAVDGDTNLVMTLRNVNRKLDPATETRFEI
jgi:hypothetical protein